MFMVAALKTNEAVHYFSEELLCVLPVINLVISPSKSVKAVASHVLSRFSLLVLDLPNYGKLQKVCWERSS